MKKEVPDLDMGLDDFGSDSEESTDDTDTETEDPVDQSRKRTTREHIAQNIKERVWNSTLDVNIEDGRIEGDINDLALVYALMTMDFDDSSFQSLVTDDLQD